MEEKEKVLIACIDLFNEKGLKFTMDDLARSLQMSKKTLYAIFKDKNSLFLEMVEYLFQGIKKSEAEVLENNNLTTLEKIHQILGVLPDGYKQIDFRQLFSLKAKYPKVFKKVEEHLETGWESTIELLEKGMNEGVIRNVSIPIVKMMLEASLEQFFQQDILIQNNLTYQQALDEVVDIIVNGIASRN